MGLGYNFKTEKSERINKAIFKSIFNKEKKTLEKKKSLESDSEEIDRIKLILKKKIKKDRKN